MKKGIDISKWQGTVDFKKVATQVDFVILREGYRKAIDGKFLEYVSGAKSAGIDIHGVYHFIYAMSVQAAKEEAASAIANVQKAGLPKTTRIWADLEYDTITKAAASGVTIGNNEINAFTVAFCEAVLAAGYKTGIYTNIDFYKNKYTKETLSKYPIWLADYSGEADYSCIDHQYSSSGKVNGISGNVDMDYCYCSDCDDDGNGASYQRSKVLKIMESWIGAVKGGATHKHIVDTYNKITPLPASYKLTYTDAWCAGTVSAAFHEAGYDAIFPSECSCSRMITKAKKMGIWQELDSYVPSPGDCILYDWDDNGAGDNTGNPDHVGMIRSVSGNTMKIIEGNYSKSVKERTLQVNARYIRGFVCPKFSETAGQKSEEPKKTEDKPVSSAPSYKAGGVYTLQVELRVRTGPGTNYSAKSHAQLTSDGKKHDVDNDGCLDKGTKITCNEIKKVGNDIWIKAPSGWLAAYYNGNVYIK